MELYFFPLIFIDESILIKYLSVLNTNKIFPRRYFYPSINTIRHINSNIICEVSKNISSRILCLPLSFDLKESDIDQICNLIKNNL